MEMCCLEALGAAGNGADALIQSMKAGRPGTGHLPGTLLVVGNFGCFG